MEADVTDHTVTGGGALRVCPYGCNIYRLTTFWLQMVGFIILGIIVDCRANMEQYTNIIRSYRTRFRRGGITLYQDILPTGANALREFAII